MPRHLAGLSHRRLRVRNDLVSCLSSQKGATAIEYALIAGLIAVVIIGALTLVGSDLGTSYQDLADSI